MGLDKKVVKPAELQSRVSAMKNQGLGPADAAQFALKAAAAKRKGGAKEDDAVIGAKSRVSLSRVCLARKRESRCCSREPSARRSGLLTEF